MIKSIITQTSSNLTNNLVSKDELRRRKQLEYLKHYRKKRKDSVKEIKVTIPIDEYNTLKDEALKYGITINKLLLKFAKAYKDNTYLVPQDIDDKLQKLIFLLRNIANNINQTAKHSNIFKSIISTNTVLKNLQTLEKSIIDFIKNPQMINGKKDDNKKPIKKKANI